MKKGQRLYLFVVGLNVLLCILALDAHFNWKGFQVKEYIPLVFTVSILACLGALTHYYYPSTGKIALGSALIIVFNLTFCISFELSENLSKPYITTGFCGFTLGVFIIGVVFVLNYYDAKKRATYGGTSRVKSTYAVSGNLGSHYRQNAVLPTILYHGTTRLENAMDILNSGFIIGHGNSHGTGLYLGDLETAKNYAKGAGSVIKIRFEAPFNQIAEHSTVVNSPDFRNWSSRYGNGNPGDNLTNYTVKVLKKRFLRVSDNFYVALAHRTNQNERVVFEGLTILGVLDAQGNPI